MTHRSGLRVFIARQGVIWFLLALPATYIVWARALDALSYGEVINLSGQWSIGLLCTALLTTPLNQLFPKHKISRLLIQHRRAIGVASFGYGLVHTAIYLDKKWVAGLVLKEGQDPSLLTGWFAFLIFVVLAITSNNTSVRKLGKNWKKLHRSVYFATALAFGHWVLTSINPMTAIGIAIAVCLCELIRLKR